VVSNNNPILKLVEKVKNITKRSKNAEYVFINKYDHNELAIKAIEEEKIWNKGNKKNTYMSSGRLGNDGEPIINANNITKETKTYREFK